MFFTLVQEYSHWVQIFNFNFKGTKMKQNNNIIKCLLVLSVLSFSACTKDLNRSPINTNTSEIQYSTPEGYKQVLAKVYGSYSLVSSNGVGESDMQVAGINDAGVTDFVRAFWNMQELTTDEAKCAWNDPNLQ